MKFLMAVGEYTFAVVLAIVMFLWLMLCLLLELPGLVRYLRISRM